MAENNGIVVKPHDEFVLIALGFSQMDNQHAQTMLADVAAAAAASGQLPVVLDMSQVQTIPSLSIGALVSLSKKFRKDNRRFMLVGIQPKVREVLTICRLDTLFELCESVAEAQSRLSPIAGELE